MSNAISVATWRVISQTDKAFQLTQYLTYIDHCTRLSIIILIHSRYNLHVTRPTTDKIAMFLPYFLRSIVSNHSSTTSQPMADAVQFYFNRLQHFESNFVLNCKNLKQLKDLSPTSITIWNIRKLYVRSSKRHSWSRAKSDGFSKWRQQTETGNERERSLGEEAEKLRQGNSHCTVTCWSGGPTTFPSIFTLRPPSRAREYLQLSVSEF